MIERTELLGKLRDAADELSMAAKELDRLLAVPADPLEKHFVSDIVSLAFERMNRARTALAELERVVQNLEENP